MKKIGIIPNTIKDKELFVTKKLINSLLCCMEVYIENSLGEEIPGVMLCEDIYKIVDCIIVLGGDGTILRVAEKCARNNIPILGVNLGRIGFMTEIEINEIESAVESLCKGDYLVEKRMMLKISVASEGITKAYHALNDVVIGKTDDTKLIYMNLYSGNDMINKYVADGLIISTPTGSTGYNISAGGPVVNPLMKLFVATPICAHMLTARPVIMPAEEKIEVVLDDRDANDALVTVDGNVVSKIGNGDHVIITMSQYTTDIIKIKKESFYNVFTGKLSWNTGGKKWKITDKML